MRVLEAAAQALQSGSISTAHAILTDFLKNSPQDPDALQLMGIVHRRQGSLREAVEFFRKSLAADGKQPNTLSNLANTLTALDEDDEAERCYRSAIILAPEFGDAQYNLGLLFSKRRNWEQASGCLRQATKIQPDNGRAFEALGIALRELGDITASLAAAERAVELQPGSYPALHNLGQAHMALGDFDSAAKAYERALSLNATGDMSWIGLGHAYRGMGRASDSKSAYQRAVELNPSNPDAHRLFNEMIWQTASTGDYLRSFKLTLQQTPGDHRLRLAYANELLKISQHQNAAEELELVLKASTANGEALDAMARAKSSVGDYEAAAMYHTRAMGTIPDNPLFLRNYAETLLKAGHHQKAHHTTTLGRQRFPFEQGVLALHTTAQRLVEDEDYDRLADFQGLAKVIQLNPPQGYSSIENFCLDLGKFLETLHATKAHPTDQTLRGGTQTFGALFQNQAPILQLFMVELRKAISRYIAEMPNDAAHPLFQRVKSDFDFAGSWSVRLSSGGFHTNHFHPKGWISSAFYIDLPDVVSATGSQDGWLKMGETNLNLGEREVIHRLIQPKTGHLVLFPSYFWHGTVPFESATPRLTIAFDVIPK